MKTLEAWKMYQDSKPLSPYTISNMSDTFIKLSTQYPELPISAFEINLFLTSLSKPPYVQAPTTIHMHRRHIVSLLKFLIQQLDYPDYIKKITIIKVPKQKRRYFSPEQLAIIYQACKTPLEKALYLTFLDSPCREGELGAHPTKNGCYPGLRVEMITHNTLEVEGKTGHSSYRLHPDIHDMLLSIAAPNGQVFTTAASPNGMSSKAIQCMMRELVIRAGITGNKLGPHSFRHSAASLIAKKTGSVLSVMSLLQQTETKSAMVYIHDAQDELKHQISPLEILGEQIIGKPKDSIQSKMIVSDNTENSIALVPFNSSEAPVEKVEGIIDLSEELFPEIPEGVQTRPLHPTLTHKRLTAMRKAFVYYAKHAPLDGLTGELSQIFKDFFRKR
jgi:integrase/recombinase XerD